MLSSQFFSSTRARFSVTAAAVFALVAVGGVTATPVSADANIYIYVIDNSTGIAYNTGPTIGGDTIGLHRVGGGDYSYLGDASNGSGMANLPDGDYYVTVPDANHTRSNVFYLDATSSSVIAYVDTFKVAASIPTAASSGGTTATMEQLLSGDWYDVGDASINSGSGVVVARAPNGPGQYRLHFTPPGATGYLETLTSAFTIDGTVDILDIGAVSLNVAPTITGTVFAADGVTPIDGATVTVSNGGTDVASDATDSSGYYLIRPGVGDANYTVRAEAAHYVDQEWDVTTGGLDTVPVNAVDGYIHSDVNFALETELVVIGGTVSNAAVLGAQATAQLYSGGTASPTLLEETLVAYTGVYSFAPVPSAGTYLIRFTLDGSIGYIDTLLGAGGVTAWSRDDAAVSAFSVASSFTVDANVPSSLIHDVTIAQGATLRGYYTSFGTPVDGCVNITNVLTPTSPMCAAPNSSGYWEMRVPAGGTYTLHATDGLGEYVDEWWELRAGESSADELGPLTAGQYFDYTFSPQRSPAKLYGYLSDANAGADPITVHLFVNRFGEWFEADEKVVTAGEVLFWENINNDPVIGLVRGDYRMRFADSSGNWLAATSYSTGLLPDAGAPGTAPACFIDFDDVQMGRASFVQASFDSSQVSDCGPQPLNFGDVSGHVVSSSDFGNVDVAFHDVVFYGGDYPYGATTASDGTFTITNVPNGTYSLEVLPTSHLAGNHEYRYTESDVVLTGGNVDLGDLVATRYGNVSGQISNWDDATMAGAVATVYRQVTDAGGTHWTAGPLDVEISSTGEFEVPGIDVNGEYAVLVTFDNTYAPVFVNGGFPTPSSTFTGTAEQDYSLGSVTVSTDELVTISGDVSFGSTPIAGGGVVVAHPVGLDGADFYGIVDLDGHYTVEVAPNVDYAIAAIDTFYGFATGQLLMQLYGGYNYPVDVWCPCEIDLSGPYAFNPVSVASSAVTGIDFFLAATNDVLFGADVYSWDAATDDYQWFDNVDVHLYKNIAASWVEVDTMNTDSWRELVASGDGDYRVRFSTNGVWLAIHDVASETYYPYAADRAAETTLVPARCYYEFSDVAHGSYVYAEIGLIEDVACVETVVTPPPTPTVTGTKKPLATTGDTTVTEDVTPTATPTPSPEPSESATDGSGDDGIVDKPATTSAPDFAWLFWLLGVLVLLILVGGAVYFVRRRY